MLIDQSKMKNNPFRKIYIPAILFLFLILPIYTFAHDFSDIRISLAKDLENWQGYAAKNKIAIVYNNEKRDQIKANYNLVRIKKDLSYELLKNFEVADPIIVQEILNNNNISYQQLVTDKDVLRQFVDRAGSDQVLLVDFTPKSNTLVADMRLMNSDNTQISRVITEIMPEQKEEVTYQSPPPITDASDSDSSLFGGLNIELIPKEFDAQQDDSWFYFSPSAMINPKTHSLDVNLWFKDISNVDIQIMRARYDLTLFADLLQFGVQMYGIADKKSSVAGEANLERESGHHSTYASLKYRVVGDDVLPFNFAIGLRARLLWDEDNTDFRSRDEVSDKSSSEYDDAKERDENNDRLNSLTMQAMITGKIRPINLMYNFYLDNLTFGAGVKFLLLTDIKLFLDNTYNYYEEPDIKNDTAFGIQFYHRFGSTDFSYQVETEQFQLGVSLDF